MLIQGKLSFGNTLTSSVEPSGVTSFATGPFNSVDLNST